MSNIGHRSLFNQLLSDFLVDNTRNLVILLEMGNLSDHQFQAMIALETTFSKKNSDRHSSRFKARNVRWFLKVLIFIEDLPTTNIIDPKNQRKIPDFIFNINSL